MPEENTPPEGGEFKPVASQADLDRIIGERLNREKSKYADYEDLKAKASKFDEAEQANKSELEKEREARAAAEKERDAAKSESLRVTVATEKGLTPGQAKRLVGTTRDELEKDADALLADFTPAKPDPKKPDVKKLHSGSSGSGEQTTGKERAAAALRQLRGN